MKKINFLIWACALPLLAACSLDPSYAGVSVAGYHGKWTTVVYMAADNDLERDALDDFREMTEGSAGLEDAGHTVLVLLDRSSGYDSSDNDWTDTRLFRVAGEAVCLSGDERTEADMSAPGTLRDVLIFAQEEYPADNYALIIWGHGCGWRGYSVDEEPEGIMPLPGLHEAVAGLERPLSVIAFDCCYGAMLETAYELRDDAEVLIAAEGSEPASGWNYTLFFENLAQGGENGATAAESYARSAVRAFGMQYAEAGDVSVSALSLGKMETLFNEFEAFSSACASCLSTRDASLAFSSRIIAGAETFLTGEYPAYRFIDVGSLADSFLEDGLPESSSARVQSASEAAVRLKEALAASTIVSFTGGSGLEQGLSQKPMLAVYLATIRAGGVVEADYSQLYVRGSGIAGQSAFVRASSGWVPQFSLSQSTSLLDHLYRMPLP